MQLALSIHSFIHGSRTVAYTMYSEPMTSHELGGFAGSYVVNRDEYTSI